MVFLAAHHILRLINIYFYFPEVNSVSRRIENKVKMHWHAGMNWLILVFFVNNAQNVIIFQSLFS